MTKEPEGEGVLPLARKLGSLLDVATPIPELTPIESRPVLLRKDMWPEEVRAEIERIERGEE
jgi:hypothetical protein